MRLIDADALLEELKLSSNMHAENSREFSLLHRDIVIVNEQPTVDAIPVEWIENYLRNYRYMAPIEKNFVREMIKAWAERKEE